MKINNIYTVQFRRKREGATNYRKRLKLVVSNKPRMVARKSLANIQAAIIEYHGRGDITKAAAHSSQLKKFGWQYGTGNLPAAYLVGFLLGKRAKNAKMNEAILDIGLNKSVKGSRIYALLAGALDAGLSIPHSKEVLPGKDRISGKHIAEYAGKLKADKESYKKQFEAYIKNNIEPTNIVKNFEETKKIIETKV
ncbi:MAG: 50S ribosomal protein L18 [Nanoarchaeota archaeon]